jgi:hypothetical protein
MLTALTPHPKAQQLKNAVLDASLERFFAKTGNLDGNTIELAWQRRGLAARSQ